VEFARLKVAENRVLNRSTNFLVVAISLLLLIQCFWHAHVEAGDLGSHIYNTWLAELVQQGNAPGVYIVNQRTNVAFDLLLFHLSKVFGIAAAEKIALCQFVSSFSFGAFSHS